MKNNDVIRRLRYIFDFNDDKMIAIFGAADHKVTRAEISDWLKKEEDPAFQKCNDNTLALFLNGFINMKRGKKEGVSPAAEKRLNNNKIFNKIKIALNLKAEDVVDILASAEFKVSKSELSAFFRKPGHKHYVECKDQILRLFLKGLELKFRDDQSTDDSTDDSEPTAVAGFKWKTKNEDN
jgi:uncharacterized protein YehS (DUF1456 family)